MYRHMKYQTNEQSVKTPASLNRNLTCCFTNSKEDNRKSQKLQLKKSWHPLKAMETMIEGPQQNQKNKQKELFMVVMITEITPKREPLHDETTLIWCQVMATTISKTSENDNILRIFLIVNIFEQNAKGLCWISLMSIYNINQYKVYQLSFIQVFILNYLRVILSIVISLSFNKQKYRQKMRHQARSENIHSNKYEPSHKIQSLYEQFETLKKRIVISQRRRQNSSQKSQDRQTKKCQNVQSINSVQDSTYPTKHCETHQKEYLDMQTKNILKAQVSRFFIESVVKIQKKYNAKMTKLEQRLKCLNQLLPQLSRVMNLSVKQKAERRRQSAKIQKNCICKQNEKNSYLKVIQIEERYTQKMRKLSDAYEGKISVLMNQIKDMATTSSTNKQHENQKTVTKKLQLEIRNLQQKLMSVESSLNSYQIECSKLRQQLSKGQRSSKDKDLLIGQLGGEIDDKKLELQNLTRKIQELSEENLKIKVLEKQIKTLKANSLSVSNIKKMQNQWSEKLTNAQNKIVTLEQEILVKDLNISKADKQLKKLDKKINALMAEKTKKQEDIRELTKRQNKLKVMEKTINDLALDNQNLRLQLEKYIGDKAKPLGKSMKKCSQDKLSLDKQKEKSVEFQVQSDYNDHFEPLSRKNEYLRHSHLMLPSQRKQLQKDLKVKQLQSQLILLYQQNKLLKTKKDRFEDQVKGTQKDQEKFQQQSQLFKEQIKRLNMDVRILDQCSVNLLKGKEILKQKIQKLDSTLKFPNQYRKLLSVQSK